MADGTVAQFKNDMPENTTMGTQTPTPNPVRRKTTSGSSKITIQRRPIRPRPVAPSFVYVRDHIDVNQAFLDEIQAELGSLKIGTPLYFLARKIIHAPNFTFALHGFPLIFAADLYDGNGGGIMTTGPIDDSGAKGKAGTPGKSGLDATKRKPGGPGADGGNGKNGTAANPITFLAQEVRNLKLITTGSTGGAGGTGGTGGKGGDGTVKPKQSQVPRPGDTIPSTRGGNGGTGGSGGAGGDGAPIIAHVVKKTGLTLNASGGPGGARGAGGAGGKNGRLRGGEGDPVTVGKLPGQPVAGGKTGAPGQPGASGKAATITHTTPKLADWWKLVVSLVPESAWADYRVRVGDYLFRSYSLANKNQKHARREFESALHLCPSHARAKQLLGYLDSGLTPVGVGYLHDLRPEFEQYEKFLNSYRTDKNHLFDITLQILLHVKTTGNKVEEVKAHRKRAEGMLAAVETDVVIAESQEEQVLAQLDFAKEQLKRAGEKVAAIHQERLDQSMSLGDFIATVGAVIGAVASIAAAVYSFGSSLSATVACVGVLVNEAGQLADLTDIVDLSNPTSPKLTEYGKSVTGKLSDAIKKTKDFVDKAEALAELADKPEDDELLRKEKELIRQQFEAAFQVNMRGLDVEQAKLAVLSVKQKRDTFKADVQALGDLTAGWEEDMSELARTARVLLRQFQAYVDFFIEYGFRMARAYDLYTLPPPTKLEAPRFRFDYGYVEPDLEEDAFFALERGDDNRVTGLLGRYVDSLSQFEPAKLSSQYLNYLDSLSTENWNWTITTPSVIYNLKNIGTASFSLKMDSLPALYTELKIVRAELALIGATTDGDPWVPVWLEHGGDATNRTSHTEVVVHAPRRGESVPARREPIDLQQLSEDEMQQFWGRSPITTWRVTILPEAAQNAGLDLGNLTKVELAVRFKYVNPR
jgi:hypothetical protein